MEHLEVEFLQQDKYISENEYKEFIDKNNLKVDMQKLKERNEKFIDNKLIEYDSYFNNIFSESNMTINLDDTFYDTINIDGNSYHFIKENFPYAEERRLFYVALTRTKNKVFLVVPENSKLVSKFVSELKNLI